MPKLTYIGEDHPALGNPLGPAVCLGPVAVDCPQSVWDAHAARPWTLASIAAGRLVVQDDRTLLEAAQAPETGLTPDPLSSPQPEAARAPESTSDLVPGWDSMHWKPCSTFMRACDDRTLLEGLLALETRPSIAERLRARLEAM